MDALMVNMVLMACCIGAPMMILNMPIFINEDGSLHKWHWEYKIGLALAVGTMCFYMLPYAVQWFK